MSQSRAQISPMYRMQEGRTAKVSARGPSQVVAGLNRVPSPDRVLRIHPSVLSPSMGTVLHADVCFHRNTPRPFSSRCEHAARTTDWVLLGIFPFCVSFSGPYTQTTC